MTSSYLRQITLLAVGGGRKGVSIEPGGAGLGPTEEEAAAGVCLTWRGQEFVGTASLLEVKSGFLYFSPQQNK